MWITPLIANACCISCDRMKLELSSIPTCLVDIGSSWINMKRSSGTIGTQKEVQRMVEKDRNYSFLEVFTEVK